MMVRFKDIQVGDAIPALVKPALDRVQIAMFAGATGDFNPIHIDDQAAQANKLPGIIAHGMLSMAFLGQLLTNWVPQKALRRFSTRFTAMAFPGDIITCRGVVKAKIEENGETLVDLDLSAVNQKGEQTLAGHARIALP
jgi:acyl dehydratase